MLESLRQELRKKMNELADDLATGAAKSWDQYQFLVGKIEGYAEAEALLIDALNKIDSLDD